MEPRECDPILNRASRSALPLCFRDIDQHTIGVCRRHGKHAGVGGLATRPDLMAEYVKMGARYVSTGTDLNFLLAACTERARQAHAIKLG